MKVGEELARASCWHLWQQLSFIEYFGEDIEFYKRDPTLSQGLSVLWTWALQMCRILVRAFSTRSRALTITILQFRIWAPLVVPAYREGGVSEQFLSVHPLPAKTIQSGQDHVSQRKILISSQQPVKPCFALTRSFRRKSCLDLQTWFGRSSPGNGDSCRKPNFFPKFRKKLSWSGIREKFSECEIHLFRLISSFSLAGLDVTRLFWKGTDLRRALWNLTLNSKLFILCWKN